LGLFAWLNQKGSPPVFYRWSGVWVRWCWWLFWPTALLGLYLALFASPADYLQGESARIMHIHVPSAWMSLLIYAIMAVQACGVLIWRIKACEHLMLAAAPTGAMFTAVTLLTGMFWGRPTWGTYWAWDARLTSELVLFFMYLGIVALTGAYADKRAGARAAAVLCLIGVVQLPIIRYSVEWWNTLHQGSSVRLIGKSSIHASMLWPLLTLTVATKFCFLAAWLTRARALVLSQERGASWAKQALGVSS
jgi:heme exporter protein C